MKKQSLFVIAFLIVGSSAHASGVICGASDIEVNNKLAKLNLGKTSKLSQPSVSVGMAAPGVAMGASYGVERSKPEVDHLICVTVTE